MMLFLISCRQTGQMDGAPESLKNRHPGILGEYESTWSPIPLDRFHTRRNDVDYLIHHDGSIPLVTMQVRFGQGSREKDVHERLAGLAGYSIVQGGHDPYKGAPERSPEEVRAFLTQNSIELRMSINEDEIGLYIKCLKGDLEKALDCVLALLKKPKLDIENQFPIWKNRMLSKLKMKSVVPVEIVDAVYKDHIFPGSRLSRRYTSRELESLTVAQLVEMSADFVAPVNCIVTLEGDVESSVHHVQAFLDDLSPSRFSSDSCPISSSLKKPAILMVDMKGLPDVKGIIAKRGFNRGDKNDYRRARIAVLMAEILGGGFRSRLVENLRSNRSLTYTISSRSFTGHRDEGVFLVRHSGHKPTSSAEFLHEVFRVLDEVKQEGFESEEIEIAKNSVISRNNSGFDYPSRHLRYYGDLLRYGYDLQDFYEWDLRYAEIPEEEINQLASEFLDPSSFTVVMVGDVEKIMKAEVELEIQGEIKKVKFEMLAKRIGLPIHVVDIPVF